VTTAAQLRVVRDLVDAVVVSPEVAGYVTQIIRRTRELPSVAVGASPRAGVHLLAASKASAAMAGRAFVTPDDVVWMAAPVLRHRLVLRPEAELDRYRPDDAVASAVDGFFYTAVIFNPEETADNLKRHGGFIPGIRPGKNTADYLDYVLTRITVIGAAYLTFICLVPEVLVANISPSLSRLGGTGLLIVVNVTIDTVTQIQGHLLAHQYGDLLKKAKLKGGRLR